MDMRRWVTGAVVVIASCVSVMVPATLTHAEDSVILIHVHGLGFSADGKELVIPSHHGLAVTVMDDGRKHPARSTITWVSSRRSAATTRAGIPRRGWDSLTRLV